jgi:hypothetical protein
MTGDLLDEARPDPLPAITWPHVELLDQHMPGAGAAARHLDGIPESGLALLVISGREPVLALAEFLMIEGEPAGWAGAGCGHLIPRRGCLPGWLPRPGCRAEGAKRIPLGEIGGR